MADAEVRANLERAAESLAAARLLLDGGYPDFATSRAYYAAFYAASAALLDAGHAFGSHKGALTLFHQTFVKPRTLDPAHGRALSRLFELRNVGDYGETRRLPPEEAEEAIELATAFVEAVHALISD